MFSPVYITQFLNMFTNYWEVFWYYEFNINRYRVVIMTKIYVLLETASSLLEIKNIVRNNLCCLYLLLEVFCAAVSHEARFSR